MHNLRSSLLLAVAAVFAVTHVASASFEDVDANHDGSIDRTEFQKIAPAIDAFGGAFPIMEAAAKAMQADPLVIGSAFPNMQNEGFVSAFFNALVWLIPSVQ